VLNKKLLHNLTTGGTDYVKYINKYFNPNNDISNYIDNVNYGISRPQLNHLSNLMNGLINVSGNKSISSIAESVLSAKDRSYIYRFLNVSNWDDSLIDRNRIAYLNMFLERYTEPNSVGFLANVKKHW